MSACKLELYVNGERALHFENVLVPADMTPRQNTVEIRHFVADDKKFSPTPIRIRLEISRKE
jgi:hypothetical protein